MEEQRNIRVVDTQTWDNGYAVISDYKIESDESYEKVLAYCIENIRDREMEKNDYLEAYQKASSVMDFNKKMSLDFYGWYTLTRDGSLYTFETKHAIIK